MANSLRGTVRNSTQNKFGAKCLRLDALSLCLSPFGTSTNTAEHGAEYERHTPEAEALRVPHERTKPAVLAMGTRTKQFATKTREERTRGQWQRGYVACELIYESTRISCVSVLRPQLMQMNYAPAGTPSLIGAPCVT